MRTAASGPKCAPQRQKCKKHTVDYHCLPAQAPVTLSRSMSRSSGPKILQRHMGRQLRANRYAGEICDLVERCHVVRQKNVDGRCSKAGGRRLQGIFAKKSAACLGSFALTRFFVELVHEGMHDFT